MKLFILILTICCTTTIIAQQRIDCPPNNPNGTQKPNPNPTPGTPFHVPMINSFDPNEMVGPNGYGIPKWMSINDVFPYSIQYENSKAASAPAKTVRINYPIDPKQDLGTFSLGDFSFNSLTFTVAPNTASYYNRLNLVDSLGLYVDVIAGLDLANHQAFWTFTSIDPATQLPPTQPLVGFLKLQDSTNPANGHGYVNFSFKPVPTAHTLDTIHAVASIVFDNNDTIPTNFFTNTIDAVAPTSQMGAQPPIITGTSTTLTWTGIDDVNGSGVKNYTLYISVNNGNYSIFKSGIKRLDTLFTGAPNTTYSFFVLATDNVGNTETLKPNADVTFMFAGGALPLTWLYFNAVLQGKDGLLNWATASEINTKNFEVERSIDGSQFTTITQIPSVGNSSIRTTYNYLDKNIAGLSVQRVYYRIKQVDKNGNYSFSNTELLQLPQSSQTPYVQAYPNPFKQTLNLLINNVPIITPTDVISLYTLDGRIVYQRKVGQLTQNNYLTLSDLPTLAPGTYVLKLMLGQQAFAFKVMKQ